MKKIIIRIISFISSVLIVMEVFNKIFLYLARKENKVSPLADKTYSWRLGDIKYFVKGTGEPLLLIHDMTPGSSSLEWKKVVDLLSQKYSVYGLDLPGFGISDKKIKTYTNYLYISATCDFIRDVINKKTSIITSGEAANIAMLSAYQNKDLIDKIILVNPASMTKYNRVFTNNDKKLKTIISLPIVGTFLYLVSMLKNNNMSEEYTFAACYDGENARHYYGSYICNYVNFPIHHRIKDIVSPMLLITGEKFNNTHDISVEYNEFVDSYDIIKNASQFPHIEEPEAFYKACDIFLQCDYSDI